MAKFKGKYRIESNRAKFWDYSSNGLYFITICTQNRECNLGRIENKKMILSEFGKIVNEQWHKSFEIRNELFLDEYIIMPNHIHAIIEIKKMNDGMPDGMIDGMIDGMPDGMIDGMPVQTNGRSSLPSPSPSPSPFHRLPKSISSFIGGFKSAVNSKIDDYIDENNLNIPKYNRNNHFFQPNYHDHIIRNQRAYHNIKNYIINNPAKWNADKFNSID